MSSQQSNQATEASPYIMKEQDKEKKKLKPTTKSYANQVFMHSHEARVIRILSEFQEPAQRLKANGIRGTLLVFGSARSMNREDFDNTLNDLERVLTNDKATASEKQNAKSKIEGFKKVEWMCEWVTIAEELSFKLTEWAIKDPSINKFMNDIPDYFLHVSDSIPSDQPLVITTGGGPGLMEAANRGAARVKGAKTMGMGVSLPFEKGLNPYVSDGLEFEFHYFFTRKFWMMYSAKALIIAPGGFGTMDELFELLTLRQTRKVPDLPIVLLCSKYWKSVINWQAMADFGTISQAEVDNLCFADDVDTAFNFIKNSMCPESVI
eukprot:Tbor_TRINITY_DN6143_c0_g1::TRINITY_DN6143_c0_g1_i2::g.21363::m.21363/K06966/K06966; uncharacterized protein